LRVLVVGGLYDSFRPCALGEETQRRLPAPLREAMRFKCYPGGHAMYEDAPVRAEFARDLREFFGGKGPD
jgi:pimeloyl-ACP methyl ester carboxylesterase